MSLERLYLVWDAVSVPWLVTMVHFLWQGLLLARCCAAPLPGCCGVQRLPFAMSCCSAVWR